MTIVYKKYYGSNHINCDGCDDSIERHTNEVDLSIEELKLLCDKYGWIELRCSVNDKIMDYCSDCRRGRGL